MKTIRKEEKYLNKHSISTICFFFQIDQSALGLSREYLTKGLNDKIVKAYYEYMVDIAVIYGAERSRAKRELLDSLNFEIALANVGLFLHLTFID